MSTLIELVTFDTGPVQTAITVEDTDALDLLPIGTVIADIDGDLFKKTETDLYVNELGGWHWKADDLASSLPGTIENPELLDSRPISLGGFTVGDRVEVTTEGFYAISVGAVGTVTGVNESYLHVTLDNRGSYFPFLPSELTLHIPAPVLPVEPSFKVGDEVIVTAPQWGHGFLAGTRATIVEVTEKRGGFRTLQSFTLSTVGSLTWEYGVTGYCSADELVKAEPQPEAEAVRNTELVGAFIGDIDALDSLGDGSIIISTDGSTTRYRHGGNWYCTARPRHGTYNSSTVNIARTQGFTVLHAA